MGFGLHGQTVYHNPARSITAQLGSPWPLAEALKIPVVDRLRYADIAAGGQGAPLAPIMHQACGMGLGVDYYVVNCGGIANISFIKNHKIAFGYDTGPGNTLIDAYYQSLGLGHFDDKGAFAKSGTLHTALLSEMCHYVYFSRPFPKSTGREEFNLDWLGNFDLSTMRPCDVAATLTHLTAESILHAIDDKSLPVFLCGGGAYNDFLVSVLHERLDKLFLSTDLNIDPSAMEACLMAYLAMLRLERQDS